MLIFIYLIFVLVGVMIHEVFRRYPKTSIGIFLVLPVLLTPLWVSRSLQGDWFFWVKIYSALSLSVAILGMKFTHARTRKWFFYMIYIASLLNILEATVKALTASLAVLNILIGLTGLLLIVTLPPTRFMEIRSQKYCDFYWDIPYTWIFAYTLWGWIFIYLILPVCFIAQTAILMAPLIVALVNRKLYAQARVSSLAFYLILGFTFPYLSDILKTQVSTNPLVATIASCVVFIWTGCHAIQKFMFTTK